MAPQTASCLISYRLMIFTITMFPFSEAIPRRSMMRLHIKANNINIFYVQSVRSTNITHPSREETLHNSIHCLHISKCAQVACLSVLNNMTLNFSLMAVLPPVYSTLTLACTISTSTSWWRCSLLSRLKFAQMLCFCLYFSPFLHEISSPAQSDVKGIVKCFRWWSYRKWWNIS